MSRGKIKLEKVDYDETKSTFEVLEERPRPGTVRDGYLYQVVAAYYEYDGESLKFFTFGGNLAYQQRLLAGNRSDHYLRESFNGWEPDMATRGKRTRLPGEVRIYIRCKKSHRKGSKKTKVFHNIAGALMKR